MIASVRIVGGTGSTIALRRLLPGRLRGSSVGHVDDEVITSFERPSEVFLQPCVVFRIRTRLDATVAAARRSPVGGPGVRWCRCLGSKNEFSAHRVADHADQVETEPHARPGALVVKRVRRA